MDVRVLRYFLAVCEEGSMSRAAEVLHVTQPALSRQIADLERELDCKLLTRESRGVVPTEGGLYLRRRAEEIVSLVDQTKAEFIKDEMVEGDVYIGAGESDGMRVVAECIKKFREVYPQVCFHLHSGNSVDVIERLERGLDDFAVLMSYPEINRYLHIRLKPTDAWGVLMQKDDPLAQKQCIGPDDLVDKPLIVSEQAMKTGALAHWFGDGIKETDIVATYNLLFNAVQLARVGAGYVLALDKLVSAEEGSGLAFRLLDPPVVSSIDFAWKRDQAMSSAAQKFLEYMRMDDREETK